MGANDWPVFGTPAAASANVELSVFMSTSKGSGSILDHDQMIPRMLT